MTNKNVPNIFGGLFFIAVFIGVTIFITQTIFPSISKIDLPDQTTIVNSVIKNNPLTTLKKNELGYTNILVLGIGGYNHKSGELTDTIMLVGFSNIKENPHYIFSIPRDLWVENKDQFTKINELYKEGGGTEIPDNSKSIIIKEKIEQITNQEIHYTAVIDLVATEKITEFVGGIIINGKQYTHESLKEFLKDRSVEGGDFTRMQNQQKAIIALVQKIESNTSLGNIQNLDLMYDILKDNVSVDLNITDYFELYTNSKNIRSDKIKTYTITPNTNNLLTPVSRILFGYNVYALIPTEGQGNYIKIQEFIYNTIKDSITTQKENINN